MDCDLVGERLAPLLPLVVGRTLVVDHDGVRVDVPEALEAVDDLQNAVVVDWSLGNHVLQCVVVVSSVGWLDVGSRVGWGSLCLLGSLLDNSPKTLLV